MTLEFFCNLNKKFIKLLHIEVIPLLDLLTSVYIKFEIKFKCYYLFNKIFFLWKLTLLMFGIT